MNIQKLTNMGFEIAYYIFIYLVQFYKFSLVILFIYICIEVMQFKCI